MKSKKANHWFVGVPRVEEKNAVFYAYPHAGGGTSALRPLCVELAADFDTFGVRLPGRESRIDDPVETVMPVLADKLVGEILSHAEGLPVVLYGHCGGATIAFEVARRMDPSQLRGLVVSSHPAPGRVRREPTWALPRAEFLKQVQTDGYLPPEIVGNEDMLEMYEPAVRADYALIENHELEIFDAGRVDPLSIPIVAVYGLEDPTVTPEGMDAWASFTTGPLRVVPLSAGHDLPRENPRELAAAIRQGLFGEPRS